MTTTEWLWAIFIGASLIVAAGALAATWWDSRSHRILARRGVPSKARVVLVEKQSWACVGRGVAAQGIDWYVWLEFVDTRGRVHRIKAPGRLQEGDEVDIVYDPTKWTRMRIAMPGWPDASNA